ncbi:MAG: cupin domain-containing protein [Pseudomonadota bacterium]
MPHFLGIDTQVFLQQYWQQSVWWAPQALADYVDCVDADDLAGLACEEAVESRIISGRGIEGIWQCQHGPFAEEHFLSLPSENWTLLVQGLDQWDEKIRALLGYFGWLPRWRLDDIMASYAPIGGGVGPHFDYYDVFLLQVSGERQWLLGQICDEQSLLQHNDQVSLLAHFDTVDCYTAKPGDLLYIPARHAHWGTAITNDCISLSIGFRAPSSKEIINAALEQLIEQLPDNQRYQDTVSSIDNNPFYLNHQAYRNAEALCQSITPKKLQQAIHDVFGQLITETRYHRDDQPLDQCSIEHLEQLMLNNTAIQLSIPAHTRLAFDDHYLYINGERYPASRSFSQCVCQGQVAAYATQQELALLAQLLKDGSIALLTWQSNSSS